MKSHGEASRLHSTSDIFLKFVSLFADSLNVLCSNLHCALHSLSRKCSVNSTAVCRGRGPTMGCSEGAFGGFAGDTWFLSYHIRGSGKRP